MGDEAGVVHINASLLKVIIGIITLLSALGGGLWQAATWKVNADIRSSATEQHLQQIDNHLQDEDKHIQEQGQQLEWLIRRSKDRKEAP